MRFRNRADAGRKVAAALTEYARRSDVIVLALPRGGVPVGWQIASRLDVPLDVFVVRKLGVPGHAELAMGAIAAGGIEVLSRDLIAALGIPEALIRRTAARERLELERREKMFRGNRQPPVLRDRTVILVDDGLATGSTMEAAVLALRHLHPATIVVAVPIGSADACDRVRPLVDRLVCLDTPRHFVAVGAWYDDFTQTTDEQVRGLLAASTSTSKSASLPRDEVVASVDDPPAQTTTVTPGPVARP